MYWFSCINTQNKKIYPSYLKMYIVAVLSSKKTNPNLKPYLILDGDIDDDLNRLVEMGVTIIKHKLLFQDSILSHYKNDTGVLGAFLRIDIPKICKDLNIEDDYVLYTDNDVLFVNDVSDLYKQKPNYFMACGEFEKTFNPSLINSGVMWINWKNMLNMYERFVFFIKINLNNFETYDQDALRLFYGKTIESLDYNYNYKPYWGESEFVKILHFHGPKPTFTESDFKKFKFKDMINSYFKEMTKKFNEIYDNNWI